MPRRDIRGVITRLPAYLRSRVLGSVALLPYGRMRQRRLLQAVDRVNDHTYTSFLRSPLQIEALVGPALDYLGAGQTSGPIQINIFACSNGAEAYTVASELARARPTLQWQIRASDLHAHTVQQARLGRYSSEDVANGPAVPAAFVKRTFDAIGDSWVVKAELRERVTFEQADLLDDRLATRMPPAGIVFVQNVLFHLPPPLARRAFANAIATMKPRSVLFLDGMELDMRVELTRSAGLKPLPFRTRQIYEYSRRHIAANWWDYYYGCEPYWSLATDRDRRYGTIFLKGEGPGSTRRQ
ncbi:MAG: CheR family methyltransferase [Gemmatimonadales bacterium]